MQGPRRCPRESKSRTTFQRALEGADGLQETERYLAGLLLAPAALSYLAIDIDQPHHVQLTHVHDALSLLLSIDGNDKGRLPRIRRLFRDAGIASIVDVMGSFSVVSETSTRIL